MNDIDRITLEPGKREGRTCMRGLRITVDAIFALRAEGAAGHEILEDLPEFPVAGIRVRLPCTATRKHPVRQITA